jgi:AAA+ ATPase superfamily predicted ATPase
MQNDKIKFKGRKYKITKPLVLKDPEGMETFLEKLRGSPKLYWITGSRKVGKTAFVYKLLYHISKENRKIGACLFDLGPENSEYWRKEFYSAFDIGSMSLDYYFALNSTEILKGLNRKLQFSTPSLIFVDGFNSLSINRNESRGLIELFVNLAEKYSISVIITDVKELKRRERLRQSKALHERIEEWQLVRPWYIQYPISEFGDTIIFIQ